MSPAGTSVSGPIWRHNSNMKAWQKRITSAFDLPRGEKSEPPLPPPIGRVVNEFLKVCSNAKNFKILKFTDAWKRIPPLYGPIALLCWMRYPMLVWTFPLSSIQVTRNWYTRSGMHKRSIKLTLSNSGCLLYSSSIVPRTSSTAWWYSGSLGNLLFKSSNTFFAFIILLFYVVKFLF